jgi:hypothetical protein
MIPRRTNYQRKYSSFRDKPVRREMSDKYLRDELDAIVREILPLIESCCFTCATQHNLQVGHLFERRHTHTRWDTSIDGNNHLQCAPCNKKHEEKPAIYTNKFIKRFGERAYADVAERAHSNQKLTYSDLLELLEEKQEQLKKLKTSIA